MRIRIHPAFALVVCLAAASAWAQQKAATPPAALQVLPTRIVFDERTRAASVTLINSGEKTTTYRLSFIEMKMTPEGGLMIAVFQVPNKFYEKDGNVVDLIGNDWGQKWGHVLG